MNDKNKLECPECDVDRLKAPCPRMVDECAMIGDAHLLARRAEPSVAADERALFEAAWRAKFNMPDSAPFAQWQDGSYKAPAINDCYDGWRMARTALASQPSVAADERDLPVGVCWSEQRCDFYRADTGASMGSVFYGQWRDRADEFPDRAAARASLASPAVSKATPEAPTVTNVADLDMGGDLIELTDHLAEWGPKMYLSSNHYKCCVHCGGFEAMVGMKHRLYRAQQTILKIASAPATQQAGAAAPAVSQKDGAAVECEHVWPEADGQTDIDGRCEKCGLTFQRYIHGDNANELSAATTASASQRFDLTNYSKPVIYSNSAQAPLPGQGDEPIARLQAEVSDRPFSKGETFYGVVILDRARCFDGMELFAAPAQAGDTRDAARYRYLRHPDPQPIRELDVLDNDHNIIEGKALDDAIDAAMSASQDKTGGAA